MEREFRAAVQYGDWSGTVSADNVDVRRVHDLLRDRGQLAENEFLLAIEFWLGEYHPGRDLPTPHVTAVIVEREGATFDSVADMVRSGRDPLPVKKVSVEMTLEDFF